MIRDALSRRKMRRRGMRDILELILPVFPRLKSPVAFILQFSTDGSLYSQLGGSMQPFVLRQGGIKIFMPDNF